MRIGSPGAPEPTAITRPAGFETNTVTRSSTVPAVLGTTVMAVRSVVMSSFSTWPRGTCSNHTVCQIPDEPV